MIELLVRGFLKVYAKLAFFFYYKKIKVIGLENIPKDKPVFLLPNHQNALIDPVLIATHIHGFATYLTRASVFKKPFIAKLLRLIGLLPIYRVRDGYETLNKNQAIFDECIAIFNQNGKVLAFPEATHNLQRRVRPLSKGFTRIVFQELENNPNSELQIVPIGLNYQNADACPDCVAVVIGEAISAKKYSKSLNAQELRSDVQSVLETLTTHIPKDEYEEKSKLASNYDIDYLNPGLVNKSIAENFANYADKKPVKKNIFRKILKLFLIANLLLPYLLWKYKYQPKIKEVEFMSTFRYTMVLTVVPLYLLVITIVLSLLFSFKIACAYLLMVLIVDLLYVKT